MFWSFLNLGARFRVAVNAPALIVRLLDRCGQRQSRKDCGSVRLLGNHGSSYAPVRLLSCQNKSRVNAPARRDGSILSALAHSRPSSTREPPDMSWPEPLSYTPGLLCFTSCGLPFHPFEEC